MLTKKHTLDGAPCYYFYDKPIINTIGKTISTYDYVKLLIFSAVFLFLSISEFSKYWLRLKHGIVKLTKQHQEFLQNSKNCISKKQIKNVRVIKLCGFFGLKYSYNNFENRCLKCFECTSS